MSSVMGERIKLTIFGESHGPSIGVVMDGLLRPGWNWIWRPLRKK